jgi:hypothetical protein
VPLEGGELNNLESKKMLAELKKQVRRLELLEDDPTTFKETPN